MRHIPHFCVMYIEPDILIVPLRPRRIICISDGENEGTKEHNNDL